MPKSSTSKAPAKPFDSGLLKFLRELAANNTRPWFEAHKDRYESEVREPALAFIRAMAPHLRAISPYLLAIDTKVGGSLMRVHRDVRFSRDRRPFKTNLGIQFRHASGKDVHAPGLYFHVDPEQVFLGAGMWRPERSALSAVRAAMVESPAAWKRVKNGKEFRKHWKLDGDSLKTAPRGYDADHPLIEDLRRTDHIAVVRLKKSDVTRRDLVPFLAGHFKCAKPYLAWQAKALGLEF